MSKIEIKNCVIAAGGKGTRLASQNNGTPKALTHVNGREIIFYQIDKFLEYGCVRIDILLGYKGSEIRDAVQKEFSDSNVQINFHYESKPIGSGGAILQHLKLLPDIFFFTYCDIYFDFNFSRFVEHHFGNRAEISIVCHPNDHPHDSDLVVIDKNSKVVTLKPHPNFINDFPGNLVNAAFYILTKAALSRLNFIGFEDFAQGVITRLLKISSVNAYVTHELLKDMGTPDRLKRLNQSIAMHKSRKGSNVVFIDRDGTLNDIIEGQYIRSPNELKLIPGAATALAKIRKLGFLIVLITNQPVLARGEVDEQGLNEIHARLDWLLSLEGAYLDYKFICPHHPESGYHGEVIELKIDCQCRKPKIGLFEQALDKIDINLATSWMVGDSWRDIRSGNDFGLQTCLISKENNDEATLVLDSLPSFAQFLSQNRKDI